MSNGNGYDEVSASNQEDATRESWEDDGRPGGSRDPQQTYNGKRRLRIITSVDPVVAAKPKYRRTKKAAYKRD